MLNGGVVATTERRIKMKDCPLHKNYICVFMYIFLSIVKICDIFSFSVYHLHVSPHKMASRIQWRGYVEGRWDARTPNQIVKQKKNWKGKGRNVKKDEGT